MYLKNSISDTSLDTTFMLVPKFIKTKIVLRSYVNGQGMSMLYLHATSQDRWRLSLDIYIKPEHWNAKDGRVTKHSPQFRDVNLLLDNIDSQITGIRTKYKLMNKPLTLEAFKNEMLYGVPRVNVIAYMKYKLESLHIKTSTKRRYNSIIEKVRVWKPTLIFHQVDHNFPAAYRKYYADLGNKNSTIESNCRFIKDMLMYAQRDNIYYPLDIKDFKISGYESSREYLLPEEMQLMFEYFNGKFIEESHKLAVGYFLMSCVTGLRVSEVKLLRRNKTERQMVQLYAPKTDKKTTVYQTAEMRELLANCPQLCEKWLHENTINKYLKVAARITKIDKTISMHVGRHTFAMAYLRMGGKLLTLQKILKHGKIDTTMKYVHQYEEELAANTDAVGTLYPTAPTPSPDAPE